MWSTLICDGFKQQTETCKVQSIYQDLNELDQATLLAIHKKVMREKYKKMKKGQQRRD